MFNFHVCSLYLLFCLQLTLLVIASQVTLARNECLFVLHALRSFNIGYSLRRRCFLFVVLQIVVSNSVVIGLCGCRLDICFVGMIAKICSADSKEPKCCLIKDGFAFFFMSLHLTAGFEKWTHCLHRMRLY